MKALVTAQFHESGLKILRPYMEIQHESYRETGKLYFQEEEFIKKIQEASADVLILEVDLVHEEVFQACPLKIIGCCRADPLNVSREAATERGIPIFYSPGRNAESVADLTMGFMLALARNLVVSNLRLRSGRIQIEGLEDMFKAFDEYGGFELGGATVGLVGLGTVGRKVAQRLNPYGTKILVHDPYVTEETLKDCGAESTSLENLLRNSDIVSMHCAVTEETERMIGEKELSLMKPTAYFINTARAFLTDEKALLRALKEGTIQGAALDVFDEEPLQADNPFLQLENVICTPHLGGATRDIVRRQSEMIANDIVRYLQNERPYYILNPDILER